MFWLTSVIDWFLAAICGALTGHSLKKAWTLASIKDFPIKIEVGKCRWCHRRYIRQVPFPGGK